MSPEVTSKNCLDLATEGAVVQFELEACEVVPEKRAKVGDALSGGISWRCLTDRSDLALHRRPPSSIKTADQG